MDDDGPLNMVSAMAVLELRLANSVAALLGAEPLSDQEREEHLEAIRRLSQKVVDSVRSGVKDPESADRLPKIVSHLEYLSLK